MRTYIAQVAHYPSYPGSELIDGGYAGLTQIIVVNGTKKRVLLADTNEPMNVGTEQNPGDSSDRRRRRIFNHAIEQDI